MRSRDAVEYEADKFAVFFLMLAAATQFNGRNFVSLSGYFGLSVETVAISLALAMSTATAESCH